MSEGRRSSREKKKMDYSTFGNGDYDDFEDPTPPLVKKPKTSKKENKLRRKKDSDEEFEISVESSSKKRKHLDESMYDRDLEEAIKLSMKASNGIASADITIESHNTTLPRNGESEHEAPGIGKPCNTVNHAGIATEYMHAPTFSTELLPGCATAATLDEEIVELEDHPEEDPTTRHRRKPGKPILYIDDDDEDGDDRGKVNKDEEYKLENGDKVSDDDDDDEFDPDDSDYGSSKKQKGKKQAKALSKAKKTPAKPKPKSAAPVRPVSQAKPVAPKRGGGAKPAVKTTPTTLCNDVTPVRSVSVGAKRVWVPPAQSGSLSSPLGSVSIKSPSAGLRLGLSRIQKVKSLHPSLTG